MAERSRVGIAGAGTMGAGIAQVALEAGHEVVLFDVSRDALARARDRIAEGLARRATRRGLDAAAADAWIEETLAALRPAARLEATADDAALVIEAVLEELPLKRALFATLDAAAGPGTLLATNTSALSIAAIASDLVGAGRVVGLHFFNPAPVMPLVEVVVGPATRGATADRAEEIVRGWGKTPVRCSDSPGFVVNRVNRPFTLEPLRLLAAGLATIEEIDGAIREAGFPQGPFEHIDLIGLDVNLASSRGIHAALGRPERLEPSALQERLVAARRLGRKSGLGFYEYDLRGMRVRPGPGFARRGSRGAPISAAEIVDRVRLALANEAYFALGDRVATAGVIDLALRLGAGHPQGPLEWARDRGLGRVVAQLLELSAREGERFSPAPALEAAA
jgi:3-hydroxybutyryl-CoA dehydrogenase